MPTTVAAVLSIVLAALLPLAACNGSDSTTSSPSSASPATSQPQAVTTDAPATPLPAPTITGTIAFARVVAAGSDGNSDIWVVNADGKGLRQLTDGPGWETHPTWSPDGSKIVYAVYPESGRSSEASLRVVNADGSGKSRLTTGADNGEYPAWSPDGARIAFMINGPHDRGIAVMNTDGSGRERITTALAYSVDIFPAWAPQGTIVFLRATGTGGGVTGELFTVDAADGGRVTKLGAGGVLGGDFALSPDGRTVAIETSTYPRRLDVVTGAGDGAPRTLLAPLTDYITRKNRYAAAAWTPDGKALAVASGLAMDLLGSGLHGSPLYVVNADGSGLSAVPGVADAADPAWRPE